jgi:ribosome-associated protein
LASRPPDRPDPDREAALEMARLATDRSARDVRVVQVGDRLGIVEYFVFATVNNLRQARAVRDAVRTGLKEMGYGLPIGASEDPDGRWSLYDYGPIVMHLFDEEGRQHFDIDAMWADAPRLPLPEEPSGTRARASAGLAGEHPDDSEPREASP